MTKKILKLDATALSNSACLLRTKYFAVDGYRQKTSVDIEYGKAFHIFAEQLERTNGDEPTAIKAAQDYFKQADFTKNPKKDWLNLSHLTLTCVKYLERWKTDNFRTLKSPTTNTPLVELKFAIPLLSTPEYDVLLCGTIDRIGRVGNNGAFAICDYKTTSSWDFEQYLTSKRLSHQLMIYQKAIKWYALHKPDSIFASVNPCRAFIEGIFLSGSKPTEIHRSNLFEFSDSLMAELDRGLLAKTTQFIEFLQAPYRDGILSDACTTAKFGLCPYWKVCCAPDLVVGEMILKQDYIHKEYDPLNF